MTEIARMRETVARALRRLRAKKVSGKEVAPPVVISIPEATPPASAQVELEFVWRAFTNLNDWVRFSDTKAAAVLAADGVIVGSIATWLAGSHAASFQRPYLTAWLALIVIAAFYSAAFALCSLAPRLKTSEESSSLVFYMDIDRGYPSSAAFLAKLREALAEPDRAVNEIGQQVWANSKVAAEKYRLVSKAVRGLTWTVYLGFVGVIAIAVIRLAGSF